MGVKKKILIIGLGAVGSVITAILLKNPDNDVRIIIKPQHYNLLKDQRLNLYGKSHEIYTLNTFDKINFSLDNTLIIPSVKIYNLPGVIKDMEDRLSPSSKFLILTNGINIRDKIQAWSQNKISREQMYRGIIGFGATLRTMGHTQWYQGKIVFEEKFAQSDYYTTFKNSFIKLRISPDFKAALWKKLIINSIYNPLSMILRIPNNTISMTQLNQLKEQLLTEGKRIAGLEGIKITLNLDEMNTSISSDNITSMYQDYMFNRKTEIQYLNGEIVKIAAKHRTLAPINNFIVLLIKTLEFLRNNKLTR